MLLKENSILRVTLSIYIPYIFLYALYIQLNGEISPGGGFQAGVIFASGMIGFDLLYGIRALKEHFSKRILVLGGVFGVMLYAGTGLVCILLGENFLNYDALNYNTLGNTNHSGQHLGIFLIELGVGLTVTSIMTLIYALIRGIEEG